MAQVLPIEVNLPALYVREIGRIVTRWAYVEWRLHQIAYALLDIGPKMGRIAVREPREVEYLEMIVGLMRLLGLPMPKPVTQLKKDIDEWGRWRNWVVHGIWLKEPKVRGSFLLQVTSGKWKGRSRRVMPQGVRVNLEKLRQIVGRIDHVALQLEAMYIVVNRSLESLPEKSQEPSQRQDRRLDHVATTPPPRPRSSRA